MSQGEKICVHCGESCAGQARLKDAKGNYAHKACAEQRSGGGGQAVAAPQQSQRAAPGGEAGSMAAILSDIDEESMIGGAKSCQGCGYPMDDDAMICLHCGFNRNSGRQFNTKVGRDPNKVTAGGKVMDLGTSAGGAVISGLVAPIVCGLVAAVIGAGIWAGVAYATEIRFGILAWALGGIVGMSVNLGSRDTGGFFYGLIGGAIAFGAVTLGNYWTATLLVNKFLELMTPENVPIDMLHEQLVDEVMIEWAEEGREIKWPREYVSWDLAEWPDDYPSDLIQATEDRWYSLSRDDQMARREEIAAVTKANSPLIEDAGFVLIMMDPRNIIWLLFATGTAFYTAGYK